MTVQVLPVIHYDTVAQALHNAAIAEQAGCPGVFLISMDGRDDELDQALMIVKTKHPRLMVGANFLSQGPLAALERSLALGVDATWTDSPGVSSRGANEEALRIASVLQANPTHQFFGSVAFKYQRPVDPFPAEAAVAAYNVGMIPTTSGVATGKAADPAKLALMRNALDAETQRTGAGRASLGLASGITPENAHQYTDTTTHFLVSTGICPPNNFYNFSPELLAALMKSVCEQVQLHKAIAL